MKVRQLPLRQYIEQALRLAQYRLDPESPLIVAHVPGADGFYAQGESVEDAREALTDVIEGNVLLALQLGLPVPHLPNIEIVELEIAAP